MACVPMVIHYRLRKEVAKSWGWAVRGSSHSAKTIWGSSKGRGSANTRADMSAEPSCGRTVLLVKDRSACRGAIWGNTYNYPT
jgi:hypothetical protein